MPNVADSVIKSGHASVQSNPSAARTAAVAAALEMISVAVATSTDANLLSAELKKLSEYADLIQAAIAKR